MKALVIEGSTREQGGTQAHIDALAQHNPGWTFEQLSLRNLNLPAFIDHRRDNDWSFAAPTLPILEKMLEADIIILASPVYWFSVSHLMKNYLDYWTFFMRANKTPDRFFLAGKKVFTLMVAAHAEGTEWVFGSLRESVQFVKGEVVGEFLGFADRDGVSEEASLAAISKISLGL